MDEAGLVMSEEQANDTADRLMECLQNWHAMRNACVKAAVKRWAFRPKHHYVEHVAEAIRRNRLNPRRLSCFQDESYLGAIKHIAVKCHAGSALLRVYQRLLLGLGQRFEHTRRSVKRYRHENQQDDQQVVSLL